MKSGSVRIHQASGSFCFVPYPRDIPNKPLMSFVKNFTTLSNCKLSRRKWNPKDFARS